ASGRRFRRVRAVAPINQEWHQRDPCLCLRIGQSPRQHLAAAQYASPASNFAYRKPRPSGSVSPTLQIRASSRPGDEPRRREGIETEPTWPTGPFLGRIRGDELQVCLVAEAYECIASAFARVASALDRPNASQILEPRELELEVLPAPDEVIDGRKPIHRLTRGWVTPDRPDETIGVGLIRVGTTQVTLNLIGASKFGEEPVGRELRLREYAVEPSAVRKRTHVAMDVQDVEADQAEACRP